MIIVCWHLFFYIYVNFILATTEDRLPLDINMNTFSHQLVRKYLIIPTHKYNLNYKKNKIKATMRKTKEQTKKKCLMTEETK